MTDDELQAIEARASAATPGPWRSDDQVVGWMGGTQPGVAVRNQDGNVRDAVAMVVDMRAAEISGSLRPIEDAAFIAAARMDVPALVAEVRRLRALIAEAVPLFETNASVAWHEYGNIDGCADRDDAILEKLKAETMT